MRLEEVHVGALEAWLKEVAATGKPSSRKQAGLAWRRLVRQCGKPPLEMTREDIEEHVRWMEGEGYSPATTANAVGYFKQFYEWCGMENNPTDGVRRPKVERYRKAQVLSREEAERLLQAARQDPSVLGMRDYACLLTRLRLGVPLKSLQQLRWGQIGQDEVGTTVRWQAGGEPKRLPEEVWEAMLRWLEASGRLEKMQDEAYVFTPLAYPGRADTGGKAEDWVEGRAISSSQMLANLKLYGRLAGIPEEKLTLMALRRTAARLRLEEGYSTAEMQDFLESTEEKRSAKYRMSKLPELPAGEDDGEAKREIAIPEREARPFKPGEGTIHGLYAISQPTEAVNAILREEIQGVEEQIIGMRLLGRELQERMERAGDRKKAVRLGQAYTLSARRLADLIQTEGRLVEKKDPWVENVLAMVDRVAIQMGEEPVSEAARAEALGGAADLSMTSRRLVEEIAATRYVLRNTLKLAMETREDEEFMHVVEIYSIGCNRLLGLLRTGMGDGDRLKVYVRQAIETAMREAYEELVVARRKRAGADDRNIPG